MYPLLHSPATYGRARLLVVATADDLPAFGRTIAAARRQGLRTFVLCPVAGLPLAGAGLTRAYLPAAQERALRAAGAPLGAYRLDVTGFCTTPELHDLVSAHVDRVRPDRVVTRLDAALPGVRRAAHRPAATLLLRRGDLVDLDGRPVAAPWTLRPTHHTKEAS